MFPGTRRHGSHNSQRRNVSMTLRCGSTGWSLAGDCVLDRIATIDVCCVDLLGVFETMLEARRRRCCATNGILSQAGLPAPAPLRLLRPTFSFFPFCLALFLLSHSTHFLLLCPLLCPSFTPHGLHTRLRLSSPSLHPAVFLHFVHTPQNLTWRFPFCPFSFALMNYGAVPPQ